VSEPQEVLTHAIPGVNVPDAPPRRCVDCGTHLSEGVGHRLEDDQTHEAVWECCSCFEAGVMKYFEALKE
jgi:hypothetical protein